MKTLRTASFGLDALGERIFEGYTDGKLWNGFDRPIFTFDGAMQIVAAWRSQGWAANYDEAADEFIFSGGHDFETGEPNGEESFGSVKLDGSKFYAVGAGSWTWEELEAAVL